MAPTPAEPRPSFYLDSANILTPDALLAAAPTAPELADEIALLRTRNAHLSRGAEQASPQDARANTALLVKMLEALAHLVAAQFRLANVDTALLDLNEAIRADIAARP
jgi:hypothetical protein